MLRNVKCACRRMKSLRRWADFIAKLQISLKECYETEYWIELFSKAELLDADTAKELLNLCGTLCRILIASVNTAKTNKNNPTTEN